MTAAKTAGPDGYRLILPEGWVRLNVREPVESTVAEVLAAVPLDELPIDERAKRRVAIEGRLRSAIANAKKIDAFAMYLPLGGMHGLAIPASFIIGAATEFSGSTEDEAVVARLLEEPGAERVMIDGSGAVRTEAVTVTLDEQSGVEVGGCQVVYTMRIPDSADWLVAVFDVVTGDDAADEDYDRFTDALVTLFDGIMSTFRWAFPDA